MIWLSYRMKSKYKKRSAETTTDSHIQELKINPKPEVMFIGTSMFERFRYMPEAQDAWKKYHLDQCNIFNCGVGGDRICNILYRLLDLKILDHINASPRVTVLMAGKKNRTFFQVTKKLTFFLGANDIENTKIDEMIDGMLQIIRHVKTKFPLTKFQVLGMYPRKSDKLADPNVHARVMEFNQKLKSECDKLNISYNYFGDDILDRSDSSSIRSECLVDNVHFSKVGYDLFAKHLYDLIQ